MPNLRRRNSDPQSAGHAPLRSSLANAALAVEDRVVWRAADLARGAGDAVRWSFERVAWPVEHWLVWPIQEETALWTGAAKAAVAAAIVVLAGGAVAAGIVVSNPASGSRVETLAGPTAPAAAPSSAQRRHRAPAPAGPVLHGSAPDFAPEAGEGVPKSAEAPVLRSETGSRATGAESSPGKAASTGPAVAGPAAIRVAREFANAFVLYEVGVQSAEVKRAIRATTSPELAKALLRRPPRLPANVKVPKAKVLNVVVGPTHGSTYTLSVSLLRLGVTSELRLDMKRVAPTAGAGGAAEGKRAGAANWQVTDVLG
jgi:hypothetical protein